MLKKTLVLTILISGAIAMSVRCSEPTEDDGMATVALYYVATAAEEGKNASMSFLGSCNIEANNVCYNYYWTTGVDVNDVANDCEELDTASAPVEFSAYKCTTTGVEGVCEERGNVSGQDTVYYSGTADISKEETDCKAGDGNEWLTTAEYTESVDSDEVDPN